MPSNAPTPSGIAHKACGTELNIETRELVTQPYDPSWPQNTRIDVLICPKCKQFVNIGDTEAKQ